MDTEPLGVVSVGLSHWTPSHSQASPVEAEPQSSKWRSHTFLPGPEDGVSGAQPAPPRTPERRVRDWQGCFRAWEVGGIGRMETTKGCEANGWWPC